MKLKPNEARNAVYEDHNDFQRVPNTEQVVDQTRWSIVKTIVAEKYYTGRVIKVTTRFDFWARQ